MKVRNSPHFSKEIKEDYDAFAYVSVVLIFFLLQYTQSNLSSIILNYDESQC
jgi:hypothetical protein